jgi:chromosome segregation ATPase
LTQVTAELEQARSTLDATRAEATSVAARLSTLKGDEGQLHSVQADLAATQATFAALKEQVASLDASRTSVVADIQARQQDLADLVALIARDKAAAARSTVTDTPGQTNIPPTNTPPQAVAPAN